MAVWDVAVAKLAVAFSPPFNLSSKGRLTIHANVEAADERTHISASRYMFEGIVSPPALFEPLDSHIQ